MIERFKRVVEGLRQEQPERESNSSWEGAHFFSERCVFTRGRSFVIRVDGQEAEAFVEAREFLEFTVDELSIRIVQQWLTKFGRPFTHVQAGELVSKVRELMGGRGY